MDIERTLGTMNDDKLGTFEFLFSWIIKMIHSILQGKIFATGYPHLTTPRIIMKQKKNIKSPPVPGFLMENNSVSGKQTLVFFGLREKVNLLIIYLNVSVNSFYSGKR